jgi:SAM-dependent methyltransferase
MHQSAMDNCKSFFDAYAETFAKDKTTKVVEIGSQDVNGSLRSVTPNEFEYVGVDFQSAKGVDIILDDPYVLPFDTGSRDIVLSSSCFEHSEMFWVVFLEVMRILKPTGIFYLNAPSAGSFHRYPVDCWRFYPDSGRAMITWSKRNGGNAVLLESYIQKGGEFQDFVGVFLKDESFSTKFNKRILDSKKDFENGLIFGNKNTLNESGLCQNDKKLQAINQIVSGKISIN